MNIKIIIFWSLLFLSNLSFAQENGFVVPNTLKGKSFEEIEKTVYKFKKNNNIILAKKYANIYIQRAKKEKNKDRIANSYLIYAYLNNNNRQYITYIDSVILLKENKFIGLAHLYKGDYQIYKKIYDEAYKNLQKAKMFSSIYKKEKLKTDINLSIAYLKSKTGYYKESIDYYKKALFFYTKNKKYLFSSKYYETIFGLATSFHRSQNIDSAYYYNKFGFIETLKNDYCYNYDTYFILNQGTVECDKKNYTAAIDSLNKITEKLIAFNDQSNLSVSYFYLGKSYYKINRISKALSYLKRMDTIIEINNYLLPEQREGYEILIDYYKNNKDLINQLLYTNRLLKVDSVINFSSKDISNKIIKKYDTQMLVDEKSKLINKLEFDSKKKYQLILVLIISIISIVIILFFVINSKITQKKRFNDLLNIKETKGYDIKETKEKTSGLELNLSKEIVEQVLQKLIKFEQKNEFLELGLTQSKLAKQFNTNSSYLSKIINHYKKQNFNSYLNDLRIDYTLKSLKNDKKIRKYTIKAIAEEFGFSNSESFSKAFYKKTGIYPSYFIKQLEKRKN